eukprot:UN23157
MNSIISKTKCDHQRSVKPDSKSTSKTVFDFEVDFHFDLGFSGRSRFH